MDDIFLIIIYFVGLGIGLTCLSYCLYICGRHIYNRKYNKKKYPQEQAYQERILYVHTPPSMPIQPIYIQSDASYTPMAATPMPKYTNL